MADGDRKQYTDKRKRQVQQIEEGYELLGVSPEEAERRAKAIVDRENEAVPAHRDDAEGDEE